jgi:hypothetical protein
MITSTTAPVVRAASHREAPLIALDPAADLTDVYAFRSWEDDTKAVFIMNVIPSQVPASGPTFLISTTASVTPFTSISIRTAWPMISTSSLRLRPRSAITPRPAV